MKPVLRKASPADITVIWNILHQAIARRKQEGSKQWQDGYPNLNVIISDVEKGHGYVLMVDGIIVGYIAILINNEPAYADIKGSWLSNDEFVVFHRVAIANDHLGKGLAQEMLLHVEELARSGNIYSIKADTNFDNRAMLRIFNKLGYLYCGEVFFRGSARQAFEKVLNRIT